MSKLRSIDNAIKNFDGALRRCAICPRRCGVDRPSGKRGYCRAPLDPVIYSYIQHHGEEPALSGSKGSGTIFFTHCNMKCVYCQNYKFSQLDTGAGVSIEKLASIMLDLQKSGSHNINLVNPTHYAPQIVTALDIAVKDGLNVPIVYNTSGYDSLDTIKMLDGIIDIYLPDMRYSDNSMAKKYSGAPDYVEHNRSCVKEMYRQVGDLALDKDGIAKKGLIIRLLVLPGAVSGTVRSLKFIRDEISKNAFLSIMSQYYPTFKAMDFKEVSRRVSKDEYMNIVDEASSLGLNNGWIQEYEEKTDERFLGTNIEHKMFEGGSNQRRNLRTMPKKAKKTMSHAKQFEALSKVSRTITSNLYLEDILKLIVTVTAEIMNSKICSLSLLDEKTNTLILKATQSMSEAYNKKPPLRMGEGIAGKVALENKPIAVYDISKEPEYKYKDIAKREGLKSLLSVPLAVKGRVIGALNSYTSKPHKFINEEIDILTTVANQAAIVIENSELMVKTKVVQEELETRKIVEKAKGILMKSQGFSEEEAFKKIQRQSMDSRRSMREIAEAIILIENMKR